VVIVVTGFARAQDAALAQQCGADQFFVKPLGPDALGSAIEQALVSLQAANDRRGTVPRLPSIVVRNLAVRRIFDCA